MVTNAFYIFQMLNSSLCTFSSTVKLFRHHLMLTSIKRHKYLEDETDYENYQKFRRNLHPQSSKKIENRTLQNQQNINNFPFSRNQNPQNTPSRQQPKLNFDDDPVTYNEVCRRLINLHFTSVSIDQLTLLPLMSTLHNREKYFVDNVCKFWWDAMDPMIAQVMIGKFVKYTFYSLNKLNAVTNGSLVEKLGSSPFIKMSSHISSRISHISPKNFGIFIKVLDKLDILDNAKEEEKRELREKLSKSFKQFLYSCSSESGYYTHPQFYGPEIGKISFKLSQFGIPKPENESLVHLSHLFSKTLNEKCVVFFNPIRFVFTLIFCAEAFLTWNVDPNQYDEDFWSIWYEQVGKYYPLLPFKFGPLNGSLLRNALLVAIKFDQEKEFLKLLKPFWIDGLKKFRNALFDDNERKLSIIKEMKEKYSKETDKIDPVLLNEIIKCLEIGT